MKNPTEVWKVLTDEPLVPLFDPEAKKPRTRKRRLTADEYEDVIASYWENRREDAHDREQFVEATQDWVIYAFLHENADHGQGRNHELAAETDGSFELMERLDDSCIRMIRDFSRIEMRSICWWDVQEHYHNLRRRDINRLADDLMEPLIHEAIESLRASGFLTWHSGYWNLSKTMSDPFIRQLKHAKRIFLAPPPSKFSGEYAA